MQIRKNKTTLLIVFLIFILIATVIIRFITPEQTVISSIPVPNITKETTDTFNSSIDIKKQYDEPERGGTFLVISVNASVDKLEDVAKRLGATTQQTTINFIDPKETFTISKGVSNQVQYISVAKDHFDDSEFYPVNKSNAVASAQKFLSERLLLTQIRLLPEQATYYTAGPEMDLSDEKNGRLISIPFIYSIDNKDFLVEGSITNPNFVLVNSLNKIIKVSFTPLSISPIRSHPVAAISTDQALQDIQSSLVLGIQRGEGNRISAKDLNNLTLTKATVEYRLSLTDQQVIPMYHFIGNATPNTHKDPVVVDFLLPAVQTVRK